MTLGELKDAAGFEAGVTNFEVLGGWVEITAKEILESYTAQVKYQSLFLGQNQASLTNGSSNATLPTDVQHFDFDNVLYLPGGSVAEAYKLKKTNDFVGVNQGRTTKFQLLTTSAGVKRLLLWPSVEVKSADKIQFNYWRTPGAWNEGDSSLIFPEELAPVVKRELIARCALLTGNGKLFPAFAQMSRDAHTRSFGITDVNPR